MGIEMGWRVNRRPTGVLRLHQRSSTTACQGGPVAITDAKRRAYEQIVFENSVRMHLEHDVVIVHDPQTTAPGAALPAHGPMALVLHVDLSSPDASVWRFLKPFMERYDTVVFSLPEYAQDLEVPQRFIMQAINPFSAINKEPH